MAQAEEATAAGSRALERGLRILGLFSANERALPVREISKRLGIPLATTYRLVRTLTELGYLEESRRVRGELELGLEIVRLASIASASSDLQSVSAPIMRDLVERTGETTVLLVPGEWDAVCVRLIEGTSPIRPRSARVGEHVPYNGGATPIAILAYLSTEARRRIIESGFRAYTSHTPVEPDEIERVCATVRARGYAHSESEYIEGTSATAAPVFDARGAVLASIGVTGITARVHDFEQIVLDAAAEITLRLGGRPADTVLPLP